MMLAESKLGFSRDYRTFFMGHRGNRGDIEHVCTTDKAKLPPPVVEDMREAYSRSQVYLQPSKPTSAEDTELTTGDDEEEGRHSIGTGRRSLVASGEAQ